MQTLHSCTINSKTSKLNANGTAVLSSKGINGMIIVAYIWIEECTSARCRIQVLAFGVADVSDN